MPEITGVTFRSPDWEYIKKDAEDNLVKQRALLESTTNSYKDKLVAIGQIRSAKRLLNLPQEFSPQHQG